MLKIILNQISVNSFPLIYENIIPILRGFLYQLLSLKFIGILIASKGSEIYGLRNIKLNGILKLNRYAKFDARYCKGVYIKNKLIIGDFSTFRASGSRNFISEKVYFSGDITFHSYCFIGGGFGLEVGENCIFGPYCSIHPENHDLKVFKKIKGEGIKIGNNCWFGSNTKILDGAKVLGNCAFGACSLLVKKEYKSNSLFFGMPAKKIRKIKD